MPHRRPLALLAAILTALAVAACGQSTDTVDPASTSTDPAELLRDTALQTAAVGSAHFGFASRDADGHAARAVGMFAKGDDAKAIPTFGVQLSGSEHGKAVDAAARWTGGRGYVRWDGRWYGLDAMMSRQLEAAYEQAQAKGQGATPTLDPARWLEGARTDGTADVDGVETVKVTGTVDGAALAEDLERAQAQAGAGMGLPNGSAAGKRERLERALDGATADVYVGTQDRVTRRVVVAGKDGDRIEFTLTRVGEDVTVDAPSGARPVTELLEQLHAGSGGGASGSWTPYARIS